MITECDHEEGEIISLIFLKKKLNGSFRLILNLKNRNKNAEKQHFERHTVISILKWVTPNIYLTKIDPKDAYYTISILEKQRI